MRTGRDGGMEKLGKLLKGIKVAMLTTRDTDGSLHSRPMATLDLDFEGELWFFIDAHSHKVDEVNRAQEVNLSYVCHDDQRFISVSGRAILDRDRERIAHVWKPAYKAWFPRGLEDPDLALLRVEVERAQYWDAPNRKLVQLAGFVKALATGQRFQPGKSETIELGHPGAPH